MTIVDDRDTEGAETFQVVLSSPVNATLGAASRANITIRASDVSEGVGGQCTLAWESARQVAERCTPVSFRGQRTQCCHMVVVQGQAHCASA